MDKRTEALVEWITRQSYLEMSPSELMTPKRVVQVVDLLNTISDIWDLDPSELGEVIKHIQEEEDV